ncbi:MAG: hypothetical protein Q9219_000983 [cf. Caloplaca sp. 3 TL-2023]
MCKKPVLAFSSYCHLQVASYCSSAFIPTSQPLHPRSKDREIPYLQRKRKARRRGYATSSPTSADLPWPELSKPSVIPTPYEIFQLEKTAPYSKRRFYELVKLYHPDRHAHSCNVPHIDTLPQDVKMKRYRLVVAANDILSDPTRRRAYDQVGAGWSSHPDVGGPAYNSDQAMKTKWSGFHQNDSPAANATWEDWERWYQRNSRDARKEAQSPVYTSNGGFITMVACVVVLGAFSQASRVDEHQRFFADRIELVHSDCSKNIQQRKDETRDFSGTEPNISKFMRSREQGGIPAKSGIPDSDELKKGTNTYLVGNGPQRILIDTGEGLPMWYKLLSSTLSSERISISDVLLTHRHFDHVGGVTDLLRLCPQAKIHKHSAIDGQLSIEDGHKFCTDGATLRAFHCPGHTADHMAFVLEEENAMFTGDNVLGHGTAVFEDLRTYMTSLGRMKEQVTGRAYPGHGAVIDDGKKRIAEYIEHRLQREREVLSVLAKAREATKLSNTDASLQEGASHDFQKAGARTAMEIVKIIYKDVPENLHEPAAHGVVQVLQKLAGEGKVQQLTDGQRWQMTDRPS